MTGLDGGSPFDRAEGTTEAIEKLQGYNDESVDPKTAEFARLIADRVGDHTILPMGFIMTSSLLIYDLQTGVNGFTGEPMESNLVGITGNEELQIREAIPGLARVAFSSEFANEVEREMYKIGLIAPKESVRGEALNEDEIITEDIESIGEAYERIVTDARERVANLDWHNFGISIEEVYEAFELLSLLILRQAPYDLPINVLVDEPGHERGLLLEIPDHQKKNIRGPYWLAMTTDRVDAQFATFTRDHLLLKTPEAIAGLKELDVPKALMHLMGEGDPFKTPAGRAAVRMHNFLQENPSILKEGEHYP